MDYRRRVLTFALFAAALFFLGCSAALTSQVYREEYSVQNLKVVFLDKESLEKEYEKLSLLPARAGNRVVAAFYSPVTNTLYCQKWDFKRCGHELHHVVLGNFHKDE